MNFMQAVSAMKQGLTLYRESNPEHKISILNNAFVCSENCRYAIYPECVNAQDWKIVEYNTLSTYMDLIKYQNRYKKERIEILNNIDKYIEKSIKELMLNIKEGSDLYYRAENIFGKRLLK